MRFSRTISAAIVAATAIALQPAAAAPMMVTPGIGQSATNVETVQFRRGYHGQGFRNQGFRHHGGWHHGYGRRQGYYGNGAAVLGGLAAGAIIGGAIANSQARAGDAVSYCSQRYKSYDPQSGTYLGYDGDRHACP